MAKETSNEKTGTLGYIITLVCIVGAAVVFGISQNWIALSLAVVIAGLITYIHFGFRAYAELVLDLNEKCNTLTQKQVQTEVRFDRVDDELASLTADVQQIERVNDKLTTLAADVRQIEEVSASAFNDLNDRYNTKKEKYVRPTAAKVVAVEAQAEPIIVNQKPAPHGNLKIKKKKKANNETA